MRIPVGFGRRAGPRIPLPLPGGTGSGMRRGGIGLGGLVVLGLLFLFLGGDLGSLLGPSGPDVVGGPEQGTVDAPAADDELKEFVSAVLASTEDAWHPLFEAMDRTYQEPTLVLFSGAVESSCGFAGAAVGPFYCPLDRKAYLDLSFFRDLEQRFGASGDFAQAYVIAHEIGHHVQKLLGISDEVHAIRQRVGETEANDLSVRQELQADCFAGIWAHHAERTVDLLEAGDLEEGLRAAAAIGDDRLQRQAQGYVVPESFTHGSSEQRVRWFRRGFTEGRLQACDTFTTDIL